MQDFAVQLNGCQELETAIVMMRVGDRGASGALWSPVSQYRPGDRKAK